MQVSLTESNLLTDCQILHRAVMKTTEIFPPDVHNLGIRGLGLYHCTSVSHDDDDVGDVDNDDDEKEDDDKGYYMR